ncbi:hypothetical protein Hypma_009796 [Hypsizygus marmoreus]|uniref:Uncharacterized protein n=1 Tax=Hypsizygus marmoreus TaxID=39966 RepID=A0A369JLE3_HYPMA|nr:hypothetical protein Hypma_009796 [Hypsizygus marmoreus]
MNTDLLVIDLIHRASLLNHLLQTNNPPSDQETDDIRRLLCNIEEHIKTQGHGDAFDLASNHLEDLRKACRYALSGLRRLPVELISYIFSQVMGDPLDTRRWDTLNVTKEPWTLAQVSSSWRAVALAHKEIWSHIGTDLTVISYRPIPTVEMLLCSLLRSGNHTLSIKFREADTRTSRAKELLFALFAHSHRWMDVTFDLSFQCFDLLNQVRGHLPLLRSLALVTTGAVTSGTIRAFEVAPLLRDVSLDIDHPCTLLLPWSQLILVDIWRIHNFKVLHNASEVVDCSLTFDRWYEVAPSVPIVRLRKLRRLEVDSEQPLNGLEAPALEDLHINYRFMRPSALHHVTFLLYRSSCSLQSLVLSRVSLASESDIKPLFESTPSLKYLQMKTVVVDWGVLHHLLTISDAQCLLPNLDTLKLVIGENPFSPSSYKPSLLLNMLESRSYAAGRDGFTRLESIALLDLPYPLSSKHLARLAKLEQLGLHVEDDTRLEEPRKVPPVDPWAWNRNVRGIGIWRS